MSQDFTVQPSSQQRVTVPVIRMLIVGAPKVGKTSLLTRYITGVFGNTPIEYDFSTKRTYDHDQKLVKFSISDKVSLSDIQNKSENAQNIDVVMLTYDITSPDSLSHLKQYIQPVRDLNPNCQFVLTCNKFDLSEGVTVNEHNQFLQDNKITIHGSTSALNGRAVNKAFAAAMRVAKEPNWQPDLEWAEQQSSAEQKGTIPEAPTNVVPTQRSVPQRAEAMSTAPTRSSRASSRRSCSALFWAFMAHPAVTAIGILILLAGTAALLAATYGTVGVALAGALTIGGYAGVATGSVTTLLSVFGICKAQGCTNKNPSPELRAPVMG